MSATTLLLRLALALAPARGRDRAAEEWRADLAGRAEFGLSAGSIVFGALSAAALAASTSTASSGLKRAAFMR